MNNKSVAKSHRFVSYSPQDTQALAAKMARRVQPGDIIMLLANLGVGKTTFVQGFIKAMNVKESALSPTFVLAQSFHGRIPIHHLDFYRATGKELLEIGVQDYFLGNGALEKGVVLVEWADRCRELWPQERIEIHMALEKKSYRRIIDVTGYGDRLVKLVKNL